MADRHTHLLVFHQCLCQLEGPSITNIIPLNCQHCEATTTSQQGRNVGSPILPPLTVGQVKNGQPQVLLKVS